MPHYHLIAHLHLIELLHLLASLQRDRVPLRPSQRHGALLRVDRLRFRCHERVCHTTPGLLCATAGSVTIVSNAGHWRVVRVGCQEDTRRDPFKTMAQAFKLRGVAPWKCLNTV